VSDRRAGKCLTRLVSSDAPGAAPSPSSLTSSRTEARRVVRFCGVLSRHSRRRHAVLLIPKRQSSIVNRVKPRKAGVSSRRMRLTARGRLRPSAILKSITRPALRLLQSAAAFLGGKGNEATRQRANEGIVNRQSSIEDLPPVILGQGDYITIWPQPLNPEPRTLNPPTDLPQRGGATTPTARPPTPGSLCTPPRPQSSIVNRQSSIIEGTP